MTAPVTLIHGDDRTRVIAAVNELLTDVAPDAIDRFDASTDSIDDVINACQSMGLFTTEKTVYVSSADTLKAADVDVLLAYLDSPAPDTSLIFSANKLKKNQKILTGLTQAGATVTEFAPPTKGDLFGWVKSRASELGVPIDDASIRLLIDHMDTDSTVRLDSALATLRDYTAGDAVTRETITAVIPPGDGLQVWALGDAWASRNAQALMQTTKRLIDNREDPGRLARLLADHIGGVHKARTLLDSGVSPSQAADYMGMHPFRAKKLIEQAGRTTSTRSAIGVLRASQLEHDLRGGKALSSQDAQTVLYRGLAELVV